MDKLTPLKKDAAPKEEAYMYLGPSRPLGLPYQRGMILRYRPGQPGSSLQLYFQEQPQFARLFVPISKLAPALKAVSTPGTPLYQAYAAIKKATAEARSNA